jgi:hypothetical protein
MSTASGPAKRHLIPIAWVLALTMLIDVGLPPRVEAAPDPSLTFNGVSLPIKVGPFVQTHVKDYRPEHPGLGLGIEYAAPGFKATVYVFNAGLPSIPEGPRSAPVSAIFRQSMNDIEEAMRQGIYESSSVNRIYVTKPSSREEFMAADIDLVDDGQPARSFLYVTGHQNQFVKIRITTSTPASADPAPTAEGFARELGRSFWPESQ